MQRICHRTRCDSCQRELQGVEPCCFLRGSRCKRCLCGSTTCDLQVLHGQDMEDLFKDLKHERKRLLHLMGTLLDLSYVCIVRC